ncbi:MAG: hypothetical protein JWL95_2082 [Gemmatimonadetes bacterium]|nr:hypothetical protein [Gemmatimonadota bacterium]
MPQRLADRPTRVDPSVGPSSKHPFDRDPLLIPTRFVERKPWYRRRETVARGVVSALAVLLVAAVVHHYTIGGLLRKVARLAPR